MSHDWSDDSLNGQNRYNLDSCNSHLIEWQWYSNLPYRMAKMNGHWYLHSSGRYAWHHCITMQWQFIITSWTQFVVYRRCQKYENVLLREQLSLLLKLKINLWMGWWLFPSFQFMSSAQFYQHQNCGNSQFSDQIICIDKLYWQ